MIKPMIQTSLQLGKKFKGLEISLAALMLMTGFSTGEVNATPKKDTLTTARTQVAQTRTTTAAPTNLNNGVYLYGQSAKPEEIGKEYVVFEARNGRVIGAVYMPRSEFNCFYGNVQSQRLNVTMADPAIETADSTPPEKQPVDRVAAVGNYQGIDQVSVPYSVKLQDYRQIANVSDNDKRILGMCKAEYQAQVWGR
ncbi:hypothetical protein NIES2119_15230 [[Phormidium ambiguum] IAM M-71]|uniref:Uncharacterized protein n=1 Tax=[Phormidium ambiguum] IAM M-71 TaxID=454136 RepID=A0A1U7IJ08_9CYAN|nr:hypothetical protein [Phormidium ambiguum]OKH37166.1 hypothetical protein NIES2119_15230 [Phormidium ambiguum IAM M-71]